MGRHRSPASVILGQSRWRGSDAPSPATGEMRPAGRFDGLRATHDFRRVPVANGLLRRIVGLVGRHDPRELELLLPRCREVHTWFMRSAVDLVFLSETGRIVGLRRWASAWSVYRGPHGTRAVLELPPGRIDEMQLAIGDSALVRR